MNSDSASDSASELTCDLTSDASSEWSWSRGKRSLSQKREKTLAKPEMVLPSSTGVQCPFFLQHVKSRGLTEPCKFGVRCKNVHTYFPDKIFGVNLEPELRAKHRRFVFKGMLSELDKIPESNKGLCV